MVKPHGQPELPFGLSQCKGGEEGGNGEGGASHEQGVQRTLLHVQKHISQGADMAESFFGRLTLTR